MLNIATLERLRVSHWNYNESEILFLIFMAHYGGENCFIVKSILPALAKMLNKKCNYHARRIMIVLSSQY